MHLLLILALCLHVLPAIAWAGFTFAMARTGAAQVEKLFAPQMGSAGVAIIAGIWLWSLTQGTTFQAPQGWLAAGALSAIAALVVQAASTGPILRRLADEPALRVRSAVGQRLSAVLLTMAIICMVAAPYV